MFGQLGFFSKFAGKEIEYPRPKQRYVDEAKRLLGVMEQHLDEGEWMLGDAYSIADIALIGWVNTLISFYEAREMVSFDALKNVPAWLERTLARPAVQRGLKIPAAAE